MKKMMKPEKCGICERPYAVTWTDTHGIAACITCNVSYVVFHYKDKKRLDKPPELDVAPDWVDRLRRFWGEFGRKIPNGRNMPGSDYERCERADFELWNQWVDDHRKEWPDVNKTSGVKE
jgi:hypothetical protein